MTPLQSWTLLVFLIVLPGIAGCSSPERDWNSAAQENSVQAYETYLRKHPESEFSPEARQRLEAIAWGNAVGMGTAAGYKEFLARYPSSKEASTAKVSLEMIESLAITVVRHEVVPSASCGTAEAVVVDIKAQRPGASATFSSRVLQAQRTTGEWVPLQRFVILQRQNVQMEDVAIGACFEDPDGLRFGSSTSADVRSGQNYWAFLPDVTYFRMGLARMEAFIIFGSSGVVGFRDEQFFGRGETAVKRPEGSVTVQFQTGGTMRTMLLFRSYEFLSPAPQRSTQMATLRAFSHVVTLTPRQVDLPR